MFVVTKGPNLAAFSVRPSLGDCLWPTNSSPWRLLTSWRSNRFPIRTSNSKSAKHQFHHADRLAELGVKIGGGRSCGSLGIGGLPEQAALQNAAASETDLDRAGPSAVRRRCQRRRSRNSQAPTLVVFGDHIAMSRLRLSIGRQLLQTVSNSG